MFDGKEKSWWGEGYAGVCQKPWQFSCWNKTDSRVDNGLAVEFIEPEGDITTMFHPSLTRVSLSGITPQPLEGWIAEAVDGIWKFSVPTINPPTLKELWIKAMIQRDDLLRSANEATAGMADAFIAGLLGSDDTAKFRAYATYKLELNKIDTQPGFPADIDWPSLGI